MSTKYVYICDHCGGECSDEFETTLSGHRLIDPERFVVRTFHGCTREHTILAIAAKLGIGVDGKALEAIEAQRSELQNMRYELSKVKNANLELRERNASLEARPDAAEVLQRVRDRIVLEDDPAGYFRGILDAVEASLTGPKKPTKPAVDHVHELGSCTVCDAKPQACADCGGTGLLLSGQQCSDCRGKGYL